MVPKKAPKMDRLVVNAIRRLQDAQGSTSREITNYISQEYDISGPTIKKQVQLALRRGLSFGILHQTKGGCYTYNHELLNRQPMEDERAVECRSRRSRMKGRCKRRQSRRAKCKRSSRRRSHRRAARRHRSRSKSRRRRSRSRRGACKPKGRRSSRHGKRRRRRSSHRRKCRSIDMDNLDKEPKVEVAPSRHPSRCPSCHSESSDDRQVEDPRQDEQLVENLGNCDD